MEASQRKRMRIEKQGERDWITRSKGSSFAEAPKQKLLNEGIKATIDHHVREIKNIQAECAMLQINLENLFKRSQKLKNSNPEVEGLENSSVGNLQEVLHEGLHAARNECSCSPLELDTKSPSSDSEGNQSENDCMKIPDSMTMEQSSQTSNLGYSKYSDLRLPGMDDDDVRDNDDPLGVLWKDMAVSLACAQESSALEGQSMRDVADEVQCNHHFVLRNEVGYVCCTCGFIGKHIENIHEFYWNTVSKKKRICISKEQDSIRSEWRGGMQHDERQQESAVELQLHPHFKAMMQPHQIQGFEFLGRNILGEEGCGCVLAHAPGTGKTLLTIAFLQAFLAKYPDKRVLIIAPKGLLLPWVFEFRKWAVKPIPLHNLYEVHKTVEKNVVKSNQAFECPTDTKEVFRWGQLQMLKEWTRTTSVLLVGYCQFAHFVYDGNNTKGIKNEIKNLLLEVPDLLFLDEGHFPRTKNTRILDALMQVRTKRRVLLSGTVFQNNFEELFNLLRLVKPDFLKVIPSYAASLSSEIDLIGKVDLSNEMHKMGSTYPIEQRIFQENFGDKIEKGSREERIASLKKLQNLVRPFVNWYKGEVLENLPGICDFTIFLKLMPEQHKALGLLEKTCTNNRMKLETSMTGICIHPCLSKIGLSSEESKSGGLSIFRKNTPQEGTKTKFVFDLLELCVHSNEKLLVFSQYLDPLFLLESMLFQIFGWQKGVQIFRLDGKTTSEEREITIREFNEGKDSIVLFGSIKACGEGISLVGASRIVFLDIPWNPAVARQAISRAFRIGQKHKVFVYRLVAEINAEKKIEKASTQKEWLSKILFDPILIEADIPNSELRELTGQFEDQFLESHALMRHVFQVYKNKFL
ncbi:hypothetical protein O6H91_Y215100 [Diphasiastrum complanatum]|nr:hypothetical protein O6H91_Y215100 [Diphasiastrum complanatum]